MLGEHDMHNAIGLLILFVLISGIIDVIGGILGLLGLALLLIYLANSSNGKGYDELVQSYYLKDFTKNAQRKQKYNNRMTDLERHYVNVCKIDAMDWSPSEEDIEYWVKNKPTS